MQKIDIGPKTWTEVLPLLLALLECGTASGKKYAKEELLRMARVADLKLKGE